jgi:hypothetical protein
MRTAKALRALAVLLTAGGCIMAGDYPDWMKGFDPWEGARRARGGLVASQTGKVVFATSLEYGLQDFSSPDGPPSKVSLYTNMSYMGGCCAKLTTNATASSSAGLGKWIQPCVQGRWGSEFYYYSLQNATDDYQRLLIINEHYFVGDANFTVIMYLRISKTSTDDGIVDYYGSDSLFHDTGIRIPNLFMHVTGGYGDRGWGKIKVVYNASEDDTSFVSLDVNGAVYDLSDFSAPVGVPGSVPRQLFARIGLQTVTAQSKSILVDNWAITNEEP